ncbi:MAG: hypothetical protein ACRD52_10400, partial [Candidatus Acidiferrales bacterium]
RAVNFFTNSPLAGLIVAIAMISFSCPFFQFPGCAWEVERADGKCGRFDGLWIFREYHNRILSWYDIYTINRALPSQIFLDMAKYMVVLPSHHRRFFQGGIASQRGGDLNEVLFLRVPFL